MNISFLFHESGRLHLSSFKLQASLLPSPKIWHHLSKIAPAGFLQNVYFGIWYGYVCLSCLNIMKYLSETEASLVSSLKHWSQTENMTKCWSRQRWRWVELVAGASAQVSAQMKATSCSKYELFGSPCLQSSLAFTAKHRLLMLNYASVPAILHTTCTKSRER